MSKRFRDRDDVLSYLTDAFGGELPIFDGEAMQHVWGRATSLRFEDITEAILVGRTDDVDTDANDCVYGDILAQAEEEAEDAKWAPDGRPPRETRSWCAEYSERPEGKEWRVLLRFDAPAKAGVTEIRLRLTLALWEAGFERPPQALFRAVWADARLDSMVVYLPLALDL